MKFTTDFRNNSMSQRLSCGLGDVASVFNCAGGLYVNGYSTFHDTSLHVYSYVCIQKHITPKRITLSQSSGFLGNQSKLSIMCKM